MATSTEAFDAAVAEAEAPDVQTLEFCGEKIIVTALPTMTLLKFAKVASRGTGTGDMEGLAALYDMVAGVVLPSERARFEQLATDNKVDGEQLMAFVSAAIAADAGRPTKPSSSSPQSLSPGLSSSSGVSGRVVDLGDGRIVEIRVGETAAQATARALLMEIPGEWDDENTIDGLVEYED